MSLARNVELKAHTSQIYYVRKSAQLIWQNVKLLFFFVCGLHDLIFRFQSEISDPDICIACLRFLKRVSDFQLKVSGEDETFDIVKMSGNTLLRAQKCHKRPTLASILL